MTCNSTKELYKNDTFAIYKDKVVQGDHTATVISDTEMKSDFHSSYKMPTKKVLDFKFALNGTDNERHPGEDHHLVLSPVNGKQTAPIFTFAETDPKEALYDELLRNDYLENSVELTIQCDMRKVLKDFEELGYFVLFTGEKFYAKDIKGVFLAGSTLPLSWNFSSLINMPEFQLHDPDNDGIYNVKINISKFQTVDDTQFSNHWKLEEDLSYFPQFQSDIPLLNTLYNMSLEEMLLDIESPKCNLQSIVLSIEPEALGERVKTDGDQFIYILKGCIVFCLGDEKINLNEGDFLFFDGKVEHVCENHGKETAVLLGVYLLKE